MWSQIEALEAQLRDAHQKAAQLFNWLKDVTPQDPDLNTKLDDAIAEVHHLIAVKVDLEEQIADLKRQNKYDNAIDRTDINTRYSR